jgi:hypothetical protein
MCRQAATNRLVILPLHTGGVDSVYLQTSESILRTEIEKLSRMEVVSVRQTKEALGGATCTERECALEIGRQLNASRVLACQLSALGQKIIVQYFIVDVPTGKQVLIDQTTAENAEDLETLMKRLAKSAVGLEAASSNAEVGTILASETQEPARKASRNNFGISFGYLFPQMGYDNGTRSLVLDGRFDHEVNDFAVGLLVGIREGFAMNLYGSYLFSRTDFCPYLGAQMGFHWVSHSDAMFQAHPPRTDGFEIGAHTGIRIMHTYNFQMVFNVEYIYTVNFYDDQAIVFTIGIL